ncbi:unnamed protein product [Urochloa humidicola]
MEKSTAVDSAPVHGGRPPLGSTPLLVYDHGMPPNNNRQTAFSIADQSHVFTDAVVPELTENNFHVTPHGWVFLRDTGDSPRTRLWDPRSGDTLALPDMADHELPVYWKCYLSDAPTAPSCVVLVLHMAEPKFLYCRVGDEDAHWTLHEYDIGDVALPASYAPPRRRVIQQAAAAGGRFYFGETGKLGVIEFSPEPEFRYRDYTHAEYPDGSRCSRSILVASGDGELFDVEVYHKGITPEILTVRVYKFDLLSAGPTTAAALQGVDDLGDRVFLLSYPNAQVLCSASKYGIKGNRIYFMHNVMDEPDGGLLHVFDLDNHSVETVRPCQDMTELMCNPFWMLPTDYGSAQEAKH